MNSPDETRVRLYANPRILWSSEETRDHAEGSVFMPGVTESLTRPARVRVAWQDEDGVERTEEVDGLLAVCLQHEIDQLDGVFCPLVLVRSPKMEQNAHKY